MYAGRKDKKVTVKKEKSAVFTTAYTQKLLPTTKKPKMCNTGGNPYKQQEDRKDISKPKIEDQY